MTDLCAVAMVDGVRVMVPDSLELITPYVLREQGDWFEDEIKFVRVLLTPGQQVLDIGANYGVYTLSMAKTVGPSGRVWAYEPATSTADILAAGIAENKFENVVLERCALSHIPGMGRLNLSEDAELNSLSGHDISAGVPVSSHSEAVRLTTLDEQASLHQWTAIDFIKMDAEGEELNILRGGHAFLAEQSPLIQYEIKAGNEIHMELVQAFSQLGYDAYMLIPGLNVLAPFNADAPADSYLLNLFCCKPARASVLAARGLLVSESALTAANKIEPVKAHEQWPRSLADFPYAKSLFADWHRTMAGGANDANADIDTVLALHARSRDASHSSAVRVAALMQAMSHMQHACAQSPGHLRLLTLARIAREAGARAIAMHALGAFLRQLSSGSPIEVSEPFLPPLARFEMLAADASPDNWVVASALEALELAGAYSSFYTGAAALARLDAIVQTGLAGDEIVRRLALVRERFS